MSERGTSAAKEAANEVNRATAGAQADIQADLGALKDDVARLAEQLAGLVSSTGSTAFANARASVEGVAGEAREAVGEVAETFTDAIDESLANRPYTTLAMALGLGFLFGALWRR